MQTSCIWSQGRRGLISVLRLIAVLIFSASPWFGGRVFAQEKPLIVSSFTVIQDWVQTIGGKGFESISIIPPRSEAHGFQLSPRNAKDLRRATLIVALSPEFEPWLAAWGKANQRTDSILWLHSRADAHAGHDCADIPHAWTDPIEVKKMVKSLAERLRKIGAGADSQSAYEQYLKEIDAVDSELSQLFREIPPGKRAFISHHANLEHFAKHFGLTVAGTIIASGSGELADPSARHFSELRALIRKQKICVIVTDAGQNEAFARRLTEDAGLPPPLSLSFEYLEPPGQPGDSWTSMMLTNGKRLQRALLLK
jgi:ABC-type Zn uptake system ZnuABC Zn-binding protein ZnuA